MKASTFWKTVVADRSDFLARLLAVLEEAGIRFCVIGGQAVNAYVDPVVSLDLDIAIAAEHADEIEPLLASHFRVERFPFSLNISDPRSDLRVQVQTDPRYAAFVEGATRRDVLGIVLPVAAIEDILRGKVWAASDASRRPSKRLKDLSDIARILELRPDLGQQVPADIRDKLL
jgi:hypothetical protein